MSPLHWLAPAAWAAGTAVWGLSHRSHRSRLRFVPLRIAVGGTRGKTTTVRLLTEALRLAGHTVCARSAGRRPEETLQGRAQPEPIDWRGAPRAGQPDLDEVRRWVRAAIAQVEPSALVVENSAFTPESMWAFGHHIVMPTMAVITDAARDHLDVWPPEPWAIADLHVRAVPRGVAIVTACDLVAEAGVRRGNTVIPPPPWKDHPDLPAWMRGHLGLTLAVVNTLSVRGCESASVRGRVGRLAACARAMLPGPSPLPSGAHFIDLFDANDPSSTGAALEGATDRVAPGRLVALFAHRRDRPWRWTMFKPWLAEVFDEALRFRQWPDENVIRRLRSSGPGDIFVGVGNAVGPAEGLLAAIASAGFR